MSTMDSDGFLSCRREATTVPAIPPPTMITSAIADSACPQCEEAGRKCHWISYMCGAARIIALEVGGAYGRMQSAAAIQSYIPPSRRSPSMRKTTVGNDQSAHRHPPTLRYHIHRLDLSAASSGTVMLRMRVGRLGMLSAKAGCVGPGWRQGVEIDIVSGNDRVLFAYCASRLTDPWT